MSVDISKMQPYGGPMSPSNFSQSTLALFGIGLLLTAYFFIQEVTVEAKKRSIVTEVMLAGLAAVFLGFGTVTLALWVGIWI